MPYSQRQCIGIDLSNVIINFRGRPRKETARETFPLMEGALDGVSQFMQIFRRRVFVVCSNIDMTEEVMQKWLRISNFAASVGLENHQVQRVSDVGDMNGKLLFCKEKRITHFVSAEAESLSHLVEYVHNRYLFKPQPKEIEPFPEVVARVRLVQKFSQLVPLIRSEFH